MKTAKFRLLGLAALAASALALGAPAFAHDGYYGRAHFGHPGHRVVVVRPVVVYRPGPAYYAPAPVYYPPASAYYPPASAYYPPASAYYPPAPEYYESSAAATLGGAVAGAAIGAIASHGRPGAIAAGTVIGAVVGNGLAR